MTGTEGYLEAANTCVFIFQIRSLRNIQGLLLSSLAVFNLYPVKQETLSLFYSEATLMAEMNLDMGEGDRNPELLFNLSSVFPPMMISFVRVVLMQSLWSGFFSPLKQLVLPSVSPEASFFQLLCVVALCNVTQ